MARTHHHGEQARKRYFAQKYYGGSPPHDETPPKLKRRKPYGVWMRTPGWWIREWMTVPQRAQTQTLLRVTEKLADLEDAPFFPLAKKPMLYYW